MYKKILIATDGTDFDTKAVKHGVDLARSVGAPVVFVTVTQMWPALEIAHDVEDGDLNAVETYESLAAKSAQVILDGCAAHASSKGVEAVLRHVPDRKPAEGILETAEKEGCDLIVMATHGRRGLQRIMIGGQTAEVIALSTRPVLAVR